MKNTPQRSCEEQHSHIPVPRMRVQCMALGITMVCRSMHLSAATHCTEAIKDEEPGNLVAEQGKLSWAMTPD